MSEHKYSSYIEHYKSIHGNKLASPLVEPIFLGICDQKLVDLYKSVLVIKKGADDRIIIEPVNLTV